MKPWATTTTGSRSSAKPTQKSKRLSSWAPRVLRRSIFTESFCCNKGAWTKTLRKEPRKAWKRRFSSIRSSRPPSKDCPRLMRGSRNRSEEHTSELQSRSDLVCRLLLEKKKKIEKKTNHKQ